jgi:transposase-like protein
MTRELTEKEKEAVDAVEGARREGSSLRAYAKKHDLTTRVLYNTIARLRRKGLLGKRSRSRPGKSVAVGREAPRTNPPPREGKAPHGSVVCRIVHPGGYLIECTQWPPLSWLESLSGNSTGAATRAHNGAGAPELRNG